MNKLSQEEKKEIALKLKKDAGAKHLYVDYRYDNVESSSVLLYSDAQRDFVENLVKSGDSFFKDIVKELCCTENADWTAEELKAAYWERLNILDIV